MKAINLILAIFIALTVISCGPSENKKSSKEPVSSYIPVDKGFSEYISGYTSGVIPANAAIEIRFNPEFAKTIDKSKLSGLFTFEPAIRGRAQWTDDVTLVFRPVRILDPGKVYTGGFNLSRIASVKDRLKVFPMRIQTVNKNFQVTYRSLECTGEESKAYDIHGDLIASDYIESSEIESYLEASLNRKDIKITWDHSSADNVHKFTIPNVERGERPGELVLRWDGSPGNINQKGTASINIPPLNEFSVQDIIAYPGESQRIEVIFSDPVDPKQELDGIVWLNPSKEITTQVTSNLMTIFPVNTMKGVVTLNIETTLKNAKGAKLTAPASKEMEFSVLQPGLMAVGEGVILPASDKLVFPFKAANLKSVDLRIIKVFENNLPYFLQENDLNGRGYLKKFGRPVYSGKVDLTTGQAATLNKWNLYTVNLSDYIDVEPGILYTVELGMRPSYSLYPCSGTIAVGKYEEMLVKAEAEQSGFWDDPENYYENVESSLFYRYAYNWEDRYDPCKEAFYSPDKNLTKNLLASNIGLIAKMGEDKNLHIYATDIRTADPISGVSIDVYDLQMQVIGSGSTLSDGNLAIYCPRNPFLIIAKKDNDRNYLKTGDGSSLSLSSFDVSGVKPEKGIKAFIYGERDVWRPGDSIYLSVFIRDLTSSLPEGHPVQFELINPMEQRVDNQVQNLNSSKLLLFGTKTSADAVTGNYTAIFKIGGASFSKRVRIETIKPNRLKIDLSFPKELLGVDDKNLQGALSVKWLNGAVAKGLNVIVDYMFSPVKTVFDKYKQFEFDDPAIKPSFETVKALDGTINDQGRAWFGFGKQENIVAPGMLNAVFTTRVFEKGGDASISQKSYRYAPYTEFVGINLPGLSGKSRMLFTDKENEVKLVTVDKNGNPVNSQVTVTVYKISFRWWWESNDENLGSYISNENYRPVLTKTISTRNGEASFSFVTSKENWGRYLIRATSASGHSTGKILLIDWPWDYGMKENSTGATLLTVNTDKDKYNVGETIRLSFPSPENARAIITLENSTGIVEEMRISTSGGNTIVNLQAKPGMAPNVYASVTVIQPHAQSVNDMPVRLYGVVPVMVEDPGTRITPVISAPDEIRSQKPMEIKVSEKNGKPMSYTLAVVDEGLLDITGYKTPDPWSYFYAREALGVKTWDLYDYVLGAFGGTLERIFAIGGDGAAADKSANKAKRFIPIVKFLGPFDLGSGKTNSHTINLPQYTGSVKAMVIAGNERAYGFADKSILVKDPLMVLATAPRVLSPGEKVTLPVTLFIQKENIKNVTVNVDGNEMITFDQKSQNVKIDEIGEKDIEFSYTVGNKTGKASIKVTATGNGENAIFSLEIEVRQPNPPETRSDLKILKQGDKFDKSFTPFGMEGTSSAVLEVSSLPSINLESRLGYLIEYPHGCSEQITSSVFPQLWIKEISGNNEALVQKASENVKAAITKLISRQMSNGGIALWPGSLYADNWVTSYAGHFMIEAEKMGYSIPSGFKQKWINYQKNVAQDWRWDPNFKYSSSDQAYRLFTLALAGQADKGAMNRMREVKDLPNISRWLLAASFATTGRSEVATQLIDVRNLEPGQDYYDYYYGSMIRDKAIILYTLTILKNEEAALTLLKSVCEEFNREYWCSTQSLAWGLFSYMKFAEMIPTGQGGTSKISVTLNGEKSEAVINPKQITSVPLKIKGTENALSVENTTQAPLYVTLIQKGIPLRSDLSKDEKGLSMKVEYLNMNLTAIDQKNLVQGTDFLMVVKVTNTTYRRVDNIALTQMVPSGWEIRNTRLYDTDYGLKENEYDYRDFRDDRVFTYFGLDAGQTKTFGIVLNAAYKGEYWQPAVACEAMYTPNCFSRLPGNTVKVTGSDIE